MKVRGKRVPKGVIRKHGTYCGVRQRRLEDKIILEDHFGRDLSALLCIHCEMKNTINYT